MTQKTKSLEWMTEINDAVRQASDQTTSKIAATEAPIVQSNPNLRSDIGSDLRSDVRIEPQLSTNTQPHAQAQTAATPVTAQRTTITAPPPPVPSQSAPQHPPMQQQQAAVTSQEAPIITKALGTPPVAEPKADTDEALYPKEAMYADAAVFAREHMVVSDEEDPVLEAAAPEQDPEVAIAAMYESVEAEKAGSSLRGFWGPTKWGVVGFVAGITFWNMVTWQQSDQQSQKVANTPPSPVDLEMRDKAVAALITDTDSPKKDETSLTEEQNHPYKSMVTNSSLKVENTPTDDDCVSLQLNEQGEIVQKRCEEEADNTSTASIEESQSKPEQPAALNNWTTTSTPTTVVSQ